VGLGLPSLVAVAAPIDPRRQERARGKCLERLLLELTELGTRDVLLESRQERRDVHDRKAIAAAQQRGGHTLRTCATPSVGPTKNRCSG